MVIDCNVYYGSHIMNIAPASLRHSIKSLLSSPSKAGNFNNDDNSDLAIGVPDESVVNNTNAGAVNVIYGAVGVNINSAGLSPNVPVDGIGRYNQIWTQDSPNIEDDAEPNDMFGSSLG